MKGMRVFGLNRFFFSGKRGCDAIRFWCVREKTVTYQKTGYFVVLLEYFLRVGKLAYLIMQG